MDGPAFPSDWHAPPASAGKAAAPGGFHPFGKDGFSFWDLVDIVNPLQHIPVISTIYRKITGDALDPLPRLSGGALFGGIAGIVSAVANLVVNEATGRDIGANVFALIENGLGLSGGEQSDPGMLADQILAEMPEPEPRPELPPEPPGPAFSAGWQAAMAMQYCDVECLDPKRSFMTDAAITDAARTAIAFSAAATAAGGKAVAAARYAEATGLVTAGRRLDTHG